MTAKANRPAKRRNRPAPAKACSAVRCGGVPLTGDTPTRTPARTLLRDGSGLGPTFPHRPAEPSRSAVGGLRDVPEAPVRGLRERASGAGRPLQVLLPPGDLGGARRGGIRRRVGRPFGCYERAEILRQSTPPACRPGATASVGWWRRTPAPVGASEGAQTGAVRPQEREEALGRSTTPSAAGGRPGAPERPYATPLAPRA